MATAPNTTVYLLQGVPLDDNYYHTIYFSTRSAQNAYFMTKKKKEATLLSYQREDRGIMKVEAKMSEVYDCNYIAFQNKSHENKWFYGFINNVEYISENCVAVHYAIDVMQTWFMVDCQMGDCFVEREHVIDDYPGWNIIPEGLEQGPYISNGGALIFRPQASRNRIIVQATFDKGMNDGEGAIFDYTYTGLNFLIFESFEEVNQFIVQASEVGKTDGIIAMYMIPDMFPNDYEPSSVPLVRTFEIPKNLENLGGYVPRNKKLLTYPYNKLTIVTDLDSQDYRYELFKDQGATKWTVRWVCNPAPAVVIQPDNYATEATLPQIQYRMSLTDFPQCPYNTDVFKVYMGQNASSETLKGFNNAIGVVSTGVKGAVQGASIGGVAGAAVGGLVGAGVGFFQNVIPHMAQHEDLQRKAPQMNGAQTSTADYAARCKNFYYNFQCITPHYAAVLDGFFDMFGYRVNRLKKPNLNTRPNWNYVKCSYVSIKGSVPAVAMKEIEGCFGRGITFWKNGNNVGNYQLPNGGNS